MNNIFSKLNSQQLAAVKAPSGIVRVIAGAGSGKTTLLTAKIAYEVQRGTNPARIVALTFTKKAGAELKIRLKKLIGEPAEKIYSGTFHAFAHIYLKKLFSYTLMSENDVHDVIDDISERMGLVAKNSELVSMISNARNKNEPIKDPDIAKLATEFKSYKLDKNLKDYDDLLEDFLLLLQKGVIKTNFELVLVDEAQDNSVVQSEITKALINPKRNLFIVGDGAQCLPTGTQIETESGLKKIEEIKVGDRVVANTGSGEKAFNVTGVFKKPFVGQLRCLKTETGKVIRSTPEHIFFSSLTGDHPKHFVYLMYKKDKGYRIGKTQNYVNKRDTQGYKVRVTQEQADKFWIISAHDSDSEARVAESYFAARFGLPTCVFKSRPQGITQRDIDSLFNSLPTEENAMRLFKEMQLSPEYPLHYPKSSGSDRLYVIVTLCGDARTMTRVCCHGSGFSEKNILKELGFSIRSDGSNPGNWRVETSFSNYQDALNFAESIRRAVGADIKQKCKFPKKTLDFMPASHIRPSFTVFTEDGLEKVESVWSEYYEGFVYDINVERVHNFFANGICVHNCIYGWRGASLESFDNWKNVGCTDYPLSVNYRSTQEICKVANQVVKNLSSTAKVELIPIRTEENAPKIIVARPENLGDESAWVFNKMAELRREGHSWESMAILYRSHHICQQVQLRLTSQQVPFSVWSGQSLLTAAHIQDVICFLRCYANPKDSVAWTRIARMVPKIGKVKGSQIADEIVKLGLHRVKNDAVDPIKKIFANRNSDVFLNEVKKFYLPYVKEKYPEQPRDLAVERFIDYAASQKDIEKFVTDIMFSVEDKSSEGVTLSTIHSSKGLEWENVFIIGVYDGLFPSLKNEDQEEELRLYYVAITRAKTRLFISFPKSTLKGLPAKNTFLDIITS
jgi:DNA helicase-2/ATP-dependent DNA helicase PcrA